MKTLKLIALVALAFLFSRCKSPSAVQTQGTGSMREVLNVLDTTQKQFLIYAKQTNGDSHKAIELTTTWLGTLSTVESAASSDDLSIDIVLKTGLQALFYINVKDNNGHSVFRGGGVSSAGGGVKLLGSGKSKNEIKNHEVLFFIPEARDFGYDAARIQHLKDLFTNSDSHLNVTVLTENACSYNIVDQFKNYGLVIIDTHGKPYGFLVGGVVRLDSIHTKAIDDVKINDIIDNLAGAGASQKMLTSELILATSVDVSDSIKDWIDKPVVASVESFLTSRYLESLPSFPNTIIYGNMCYSGTTNARMSMGFTPIATAFKNKNVISYYGYAFNDGRSSPVENESAKNFEDSIVRAFIYDYDSTGIAHLNPDGTERQDKNIVLAPGYENNPPLYLKHLGADDYSYQNCADSFVDARDGKVYKAVCIGNQNWMAENLAFNVPGSRVYADDPSNAAIYGRLYNWNTLMQGAAGSSSTPSGVQGVCPKGWHIPSQAEWVELLNYSYNLPGNYGSLKSTSSMWQAPNSDANNSTHFSGLPGGGYYVSFSDAPKSEYSGIGQYGYFGTTTELLGNQGNPAYLTIALAYSSQPIPYKAPKDAYVSCRCVKDP